jgi:excisionase family DNA binding protein
MMVTAKEAAEELQISERFLRRLVAQGHVPFYRLSPRTLRFDLDELRQYMRLVAEGRPKMPEGQDHE